jgi:hypothetical protein
MKEFFMEERRRIRKLREKDNKIEYDNTIKKAGAEFIQKIKQDLKEYETKTIDECCDDEIFNQAVDKLLAECLNDLKTKLENPFNSFCYDLMVEAIKSPEDSILQSAAIRVRDTMQYYEYWKMGEENVYIEEERRLLTRSLIYEILQERGLF